MEEAGAEQVEIGIVVAHVAAVEVVVVVEVAVDDSTPAPLAFHVAEDRRQTHHWSHNLERVASNTPLQLCVSCRNV